MQAHDNNLILIAIEYFIGIKDFLHLLCE